MDKLDKANGTDNSRLLSSLGLCARARALIIGTPMVIEALRKSGRVAHNLACEISPEVYDRMEAELTADEGADA